MVGFTPEKQRRLFAVLSAVLLLGNISQIKYIIIFLLFLILNVLIFVLFFREC